MPPVGGRLVPRAPHTRCCVTFYSCHKQRTTNFKVWNDPEISKSLVAELPGRTAVQEFKQWMDTSSSQLVKSSVTLNSVWDHLSENIGSQNLTHFLLWDFEKSSCCQVLLLHISFYWLNLHTVLDQGNYLVFLLWHLSRIPQGKE